MVIYVFIYYGRNMIHAEDKQVVAHLYRGEMNRMTVYRQRLDITTNWAVTLETAVLVVYLDKKIHLVFILFPLTILLFLSFLEARRYRYFYTSVRRVQYLESEYFAKQIFQTNPCNVQLSPLVHNLVNVQFLIDLPHAWAVRFYRNYIWLYYICLVMMTYKHMTMESILFRDTLLMIVLYILCLCFHILLHIHHCRHGTFVDL